MKQESLAFQLPRENHLQGSFHNVMSNIRLLCAEIFVQQQKRFDVQHLFSVYIDVIAMMEEGSTMDEQEFEQAIRRLQTPMYRTAVSILWNDEDAADAIQEAILRAWQKRRSLRSAEAFDMWLMRILLNECRNTQRRNRRRAMPLGTDVAEASATDIGLRDALRRLPEKYRTPLLLHTLDGYPVAEVARMLRVPESTARGRIYQGRKQLKILLEEVE